MQRRRNMIIGCVFVLIVINFLIILSTRMIYYCYYYLLSFISRHAIPLPLNKPVEYMNQYIVRVRSIPLDVKQLRTVKSLPFLKNLDIQQSPLTVSFIPDPVRL